MKPIFEGRNPFRLAKGIANDLVKRCADQFVLDPQFFFFQAVQRRLIRVSSITFRIYLSVDRGML